MATEKTITNKILKYLNSLPRCVAYKVPGTAVSSGRPDISGCINGRAIQIEVKTVDTDWEVTKQQMANLMKWSECGALCLVTYSLEFVKEIITPKGIRLKRLVRKEPKQCLSEVILSYDGEKL